MKYLFIFLALFGFSISTNAQTLLDQIQLLDSLSHDTIDYHAQSLGFSNSKNLSFNKKTVIYPFFWVYKNCISSQDSQRCGFHPSCSVYALKSIKRNGLIIGFLDGFDRLTRCNGSQNSGFYKRLEINNLYEDEVE